MIVGIQQNTLRRTLKEVIRLSDYLEDVEDYLPYSLEQFFDFVRKIPYVPDPEGNEQVARPKYTIQSGGDCDDKTVLFLAWMKAKGYDGGFSIVSQKWSFTHIFPFITIDGKNIDLDATYEDGRIGKQQRWTRRKDFIMKGKLITLEGYERPYGLGFKIKKPKIKKPKISVKTVTKAAKQSVQKAVPVKQILAAKKPSDLIKAGTAPMTAFVPGGTKLVNKAVAVQNKVLANPGAQMAIIAAASAVGTPATGAAVGAGLKTYNEMQKKGFTKEALTNAGKAGLMTAMSQASPETKALIATAQKVVRNPSQALTQAAMEQFPEEAAFIKTVSEQARSTYGEALTKAGIDPSKIKLSASFFPTEYAEEII